jgi:hypothetical protein
MTIKRLSSTNRSCAALIALLLALIVAIELFRRLPVLVRFRALAEWGARAGALVRRRGVSEWAKERAMRLMSLRLFAASVRAGVLLLAVAAPILVAFAIDSGAIDSGLDLGVAHAFFDWRQRLWTLLLCGAYAIVRHHAGRRLQPR